MRYLKVTRLILPVCVPYKVTNLAYGCILVKVRFTNITTARPTTCIMLMNVIWLKLSIHFSREDNYDSFSVLQDNYHDSHMLVVDFQPFLVY